MTGGYEEEMASPAIAWVFPGQGSQRPGMATRWVDHPAAARWRQADELLGRDVSRLGTEADEDELRDPVSCQLALFVHMSVLLDAWRASQQHRPVVVAGHSLGEYVALLAAGVLDFPAGLRLVEARARLTKEATESAPGGMAACLGFDVEAVRSACAEAGAHLANDNAPGQVVAAGPAAALARLREVLSHGSVRGKVVELDVGAAYHSPHMEPAVQRLAAAVAEADLRDAQLPVVANVDAQPHSAASEWKHLLPAQLVSPVRWRQSVETMGSLGVTDVVELGAAPVLTGLIKRTAPALRRHTVTTPADLEAL